MIRDYENYARLSDDVYRIGTNTILRFSVNINRNSDKYGKLLTHREIRYKDTNGNMCISLKRDFSYYLSIDNIKPTESGEKAFIQIFPEDIQLLIYNLDNAMKWFTDKEYENLFVKDNNELFISTTVDPVFTQLKLGTYIILEPAVVIKNNQYTAGVRLYLSSYTNYIDIDLFSFAGLIYTIKTFNMYLAAQNLLNYLQRPALGTNSYTLNKNENEEYISGASTTVKRHVGKQKSVFD